jgi:2-oxo-4-hydroxy-4-carboxy-5-ureidoimidazoline decarboxylase
LIPRRTNRNIDKFCARLNKKDAILAAFPKRLTQDRKTEITTALEEIAKIARLRLEDAVS